MSKALLAALVPLALAACERPALERPKPASDLKELADPPPEAPMAASPPIPRVEGDGADAAIPEAEARAREEYELGYVLKDRDPDAARVHFRRALEMAPPGTNLQMKARMQLRRQEAASEER